MCHTVDSEHADPQIQHDCFTFGSVTVDKPITSIKIHCCEFELDCKVPRGGMMSVNGVDLL